MFVGVQFTGSVDGGATKRWFTHSWNPAWNVTWTVVPTTPAASGAQIDWDVAVERLSPTAMTYWITVRNVSSAPVGIEARYAVHNN